MHSPVKTVVDAVDGVHGLRVHGDELALVLLNRRLLFRFTPSPWKGFWNRDQGNVSDSQVTSQ